MTISKECCPIASSIACLRSVTSALSVTSMPNALAHLFEIFATSVDVAFGPSPPRVHRLLKCVAHLDGVLALLPKQFFQPREDPQPIWQVVYRSSAAQPSLGPIRFDRWSGLAEVARQPQARRFVFTGYIVFDIEGYIEVANDVDFLKSSLNSGR